ncbi:hypothetical protein BH11VER1_BH11VER1_09240 [soil metagenome]
MTAYIVRKGAQKKKGILGKREAELRHHIKNQSSDEKLAKAAENVRVAKNAVIKCMIHETEAVKPEEEVRFAERRQQLEQDRDFWEAVSSAEIIDQYGKSNEKQEVEPPK